MKKTKQNMSVPYKYEYTDTNNHNIFFGRIDYILPEQTAINGTRWTTIKLFEFSKQNHVYIQVWDNLAKYVKNAGIGAVVKVHAYVRSYKNKNTGKLEHCIKAFDVTKTFPYYTIFGTIGCTDVHKKRGVGNRMFSFKPDINGDTSMMYGILSKDSRLWKNIEKGKYVQIMGEFNLSDDKQTVTLDVIGVKNADK